MSTSGLVARPARLWRVHPDGSGAEQIGPNTPADTYIGRSVSPDGSTLYVANRTNATGSLQVLRFDVASRLLHSLLGDGLIPAISPTGHFLAFNYSNGATAIRNLQTGAERDFYSQTSQYKYAQPWSPDEHWLLVQPESGGPAVVNAATGSDPVWVR